MRRKLCGSFRVSEISDKGFRVTHFGLQYLVTRLNNGQVVVEKVVANVPGFQKHEQRSGKAERERAQLATQISQTVYKALHRFTNTTRNYKEIDYPAAAMQLM